jgi:hypothetical protein
MRIEITGTFILLCVAAAPGAAQLKIDHATVCGANLDAMRMAMNAVTRVQPEYGGPHSNHATEMALVSFPDGSYLELMGIQAKADPAAVTKHEWSRFLRNNAGPCAFAMHVTDIAREVRELKSAGVATREPESAGRTRPDGVKLAWQTAGVGPGVRGSLLPFLIADQTPRENRAYPGGKATTEKFGGIARVIVGVRDMQGAIEQYRRAFHLAAPRRERNDRLGADLAWFEGTPFMLAQGTDAGSWVTHRVMNFGDAPVAFLLANGKNDIKGSPADVFGRMVFWMDESKLGWRLGVLI